MSLLKKFICLIISFCTGLLLFNYRTIPSGRLWENYTVLYIPAQVDDSIITSAFNECGIEEFVSYENQRIPVLLKNDSVEKSMFTLNSYDNGYKYLNGRLNYFFDSSKQYRLYYIPNQYRENLNDCVKLIEEGDNVAGIDSNFSYPWVLPLLSIILAVLLLVFVKNIIIFALSAILPVFYVFCNPFYSCAASAFMLLVVFFMMANIWQREGFVKRILTSHSFYIFAGCSILLAVTNAFISFVFLLAVILGSLCLLYICKSFNDDIDKKSTYKYVFIRNARLTSLFAGKLKTICIVCVVMVACIFVYFILNSSDSFSGHFARVLLPGESSISSKELPNLEDYCKWDWDVTTYPYKSTNVKNYDDEVVYPHFVKEDGKIKQVDQVFKYDDAFVNETISSIDNLDFYSIEQVLKSQGRNSVYGYTASSSYNVSILSIIMMILTLGMLLFIYISAIIKKGGRE
jgi:hypothetical protein